MPVHRITMFIIPKDEDVKFLLEQYKTLAQEAKKDGKTYIQSVVAGQPLPDDRSRGYTLVAKTLFRNMDDMKYYDTDCAAHKRFKELAGPRRAGDILTVYFEHDEA